jgi:hypothetical protein
MKPTSAMKGKPMPIQIRNIGNPVVYTNNAGGGADEIQAPQNGEATLQLHAGGGTVRSAWYSPYDNLSDLPKIHRISCNPNGNHVDLVVAGHAGQPDARVRIRVYAAIE